VDIGSFGGRADRRKADSDFLRPLLRGRRVELDTQLMQSPEDLRVTTEKPGDQEGQEGDCDRQTYDERRHRGERQADAIAPV
jgi:hypothetical protein